MKRYECKKCHKLLAKVRTNIKLLPFGMEKVSSEEDFLPPTMQNTEVSIKCPKCGAINIYTHESYKFSSLNI